MCTVTVMPWRGGLRLVHNRDESRTRPAGLPPRVTVFAGRKAIFPVDAASRGTWVAASDAGLAFAILNVNPTPKRGCRSRGSIIPALLGVNNLDEARRRFLETPFDAYSAFRLVIADRKEVLAWTLRTAESQETRSPLDRPLMTTSSGLGDHLVEEPRRRLFEQQLNAQSGAERQDAFHRHRWPDRPELSVWMSRPDACTVSQTTIEIADGVVRMTYRSNVPDQFVECPVPCRASCC